LSTRAASWSPLAPWPWPPSSSTSAKHKTKGETYAAILCGANMNFDRLRFVAERAEVGEEREALFAVTIPEERGSFKRFCELIGNLPGGPRNVTEFNYRISDAASRPMCSWA
jgi:threonine dehydratase